VSLVRLCQALIWSRKSTGLPIEIRSAYSTNANSEPKDLSYCKLDIDIYKNKPNVISHVKMANTAGWNGTEISLYISGAWSSYKVREACVCWLGRAGCFSPILL
jgi:DNA topoisomerase VI subunit B